MSATADPDEEVAVRIRRMIAESDKFVAEQRKLMAESEKFSAQQRKLFAESLKLDRDRVLAPWLALAGLIGGVVTVTTVILRALEGR